VALAPVLLDPGQEVPMPARIRDPFSQAAKQPELVELPPAMILAVEGRGAPEAAAFQAAVAALYGVAYTLKFANKKHGRDFRVPPLEALWWSSGPKRAFDLGRTPKRAWRWKAMIRVPETTTKAQLADAKQAVIAKRGEGAVGLVALERFAEGRAVQMLHVGPYATEPVSIEKMHSLVAASKLRTRGYHHEIYLSDPRRSKPEKLRTILRQPVS
jgi:hypothetical protein